MHKYLYLSSTHEFFSVVGGRARHNIFTIVVLQAPIHPTPPFSTYTTSK
jgi:hypothetical protein